jgi:acetolactate synthase-1/2/3 large subunit
MNDMNCTESIIDAFDRHNIEILFGYLGGCILPRYVALVLVGNKTAQDVLCRHEQGCALVVNGYARASGKWGVCLANSGPSATNLITVVPNAQCPMPNAQC